MNDAPKTVRLTWDQDDADLFLRILAVAANHDHDQDDEDTRRITKWVLEIAHAGLDVDPNRIELIRSNLPPDARRDRGELPELE